MKENRRVTGQKTLAMGVVKLGTMFASAHTTRSSPRRPGGSLAEKWLLLFRRLSLCMAYSGRMLL